MISRPSSVTASPLSRVALLLAASAIALPASSLFVGFNTVTPVQVYDQSGNFLQNFGPSGAIAAFPDDTGHYFSVTPSASLNSSTLTEYGGTLSSGGALVPAANFSVNDVITDGGSIGGNLLLSSYNGTVYRTTGSGSVLNSWSTGYTHTGVTSNGTNVYTTEGDSGNLIDVWSASGTKVGTIATPFVGLYGLGYDSSTGNFWAGSTNFVYELSSTGSLLAQFNLTGGTPSGAVHDSLEVGNLPSAPPVTNTPEPSSLVLLAVGLFAVVGTLRKTNYGESV